MTPTHGPVIVRTMTQLDKIRARYPKAAVYGSGEYAALVECWPGEVRVRLYLTAEDATRVSKGPCRSPVCSGRHRTERFPIPEPEEITLAESHREAERWERKFRIDGL